ncbi:hypothetical protein ES703_77506 [subsurface metagenome]
MNSFKLQPVDILVNVNNRKDLFSRIKRWAVGPYDHVFMYMGEVRIVVHRRQGHILRFPLLFESNGRGVVIQSLSNRFGQQVVVMRLKSEFDWKRIPRVLKEAVTLASDPKSHYDYFAIARWVLPRVFMDKMPLWLAKLIPLQWQRDERQICSEAVFEVFTRAKVPVLPDNVVPLPGDFVTDFVTDCLLLEEVWAGTLSGELV